MFACFLKRCVDCGEFCVILLLMVALVCRIIPKNNVVGAGTGRVYPARC